MWKIKTSYQESNKFSKASEKVCKSTWMQNTVKKKVYIFLFWFDHKKKNFNESEYNKLQETERESLLSYAVLCSLSVRSKKSSDLTAIKNKQWLASLIWWLLVFNYTCRVATIFRFGFLSSVDFGMQYSKRLQNIF